MGMGLQRVALSEKDRRFIIGRSAGRCNKCKQSVFIESEFGERARLGDDAHIYAYSTGGPRGDAHGAPGNPNDISNIILLCKNCHAEVDQQPRQYPPDALTRLREEHYAWADDRLGEQKVLKPRFRYLLYLNLIRTDMYAVANSIAPPVIDVGSAEGFSDLGMGAGRIMAQYTEILNTEDMYARQIAETADLGNLEVGQYCFVDAANFRTVGIGKSRSPESAWRSGKSIIYRRYGDWQLICLIDPRWATTTTARVTLESGHARLSGVIRINRIDTEEQSIYASPLFLAQI